MDREKKCLPTPCNHLDIGTMWLCTLARNQAGDSLMLSKGKLPQRTDILVVAEGLGVFFLSVMYY